MNAATHQRWLGLLDEDVVEPEWPIIDAHHHLWRNMGAAFPFQPDYIESELHADFHSGHTIVASVFIECHQQYRNSGPVALRPVGETEFAQATAARFAQRFGTPARTCDAIVAFADLRLGGDVAAVVEAHLAVAPDRLRGIRQMTAWDADPRVAYTGLDIQPGMLLDTKIRQAAACLATYDLALDVWLFHPQLPELTALARTLPDLQIVLDHMGGPLGIGPYAQRRDEVFAHWQRDIAALAQCPNVAVKLGGMTMPHTGFGWHQRERPPTSDELVAATRDYFLHAIDCFGPQRCLFESNFPVEKIAGSYRVLWNSFKKIAGEFSDTERMAMLHDNAQRIYRIAR